MKIPENSLKRFPRARASFALGVLMLVACVDEPVEWQGDAREVSIPGGASTSLDESATLLDSQLVLRPDGVPALETVVRVASVPTDSGACRGSFRTAASSRTEIYGVWWSRLDAGRAALVSARSDDAGRTWTAPVAVDTTDRGAAGCARPAPAIAADAKSGYVHVTYFLNGPGGPGVFFSHSMQRGEMFHSPVPIIYGEHPSATAVAAADDVVVVAFEDPNTDRAHIALAVSRTWGHIFSRERPEASAGTPTAEGPLIALRGPLVAVGWREKDHRAVVARLGTLK